MNTYDRIVSAAVAETRSKFDLAQALALDIPRRRLGGDAADEATITAEIEEARREIIAAGGEPRTVATLHYYRLVALWAAESSVDLDLTFRWISGRSWSAHREAYAAGMTYEAFAAMPKATVDEIRLTVGKAGNISPAGVIPTWTAAQKTAAARELFADPEVADAAIEDMATRAHAAAAINRHWEEHNRRHPLPPKPDHAADDLVGGLMEIAARFIRIRKDVDRMIAMAQAHRDALDPELRENIAGLADYLTTAGEMLRGALNGPSVDDAIEALLNEGNQ